MVRGLRAALDPVLVPHGFQAGQITDLGEAVHGTWCVPYDAFAARLPHVAPPVQQEGAGACVDFTVSAVLGDAGWRLSEARLEDRDLARTFQATGDETSARLARELPGRRPGSALAELGVLVDRLLR